MRHTTEVAQIHESMSGLADEDATLLKGTPVCSVMGRASMSALKATSGLPSQW